MPAQCQDASARSTNVTEQQLQNCGRSDDLRPLRLLGPTERVANCTGLLGTRSRAKRLSYFQESFFGNSAKAFNHLRRVPREMFLQELVHTAWMAERGVTFAVGEIHGSPIAILAVATMG